MGFFDNFKEKATDLAQAGVAQSKRLAEIAKLKTSNMGEEDTIKKAYLELGKLYYAEHGCSPDGAYAAACEKILAAKAAIEANNDRITEIKESADTDSTPECAPQEPVAAEPAAEESAQPAAHEPAMEEIPAQPAPTEPAPADPTPTEPVKSQE